MKVTSPLRDVLAYKVSNGEGKYVVLLHEAGREGALASTRFAEHEHTQDFAVILLCCAQVVEAKR